MKERLEEHKSFLMIERGVDLKIIISPTNCALIRFDHSVLSSVLPFCTSLMTLISCNTSTVMTLISYNTAPTDRSILPTAINQPTDFLDENIFLQMYCKAVNMHQHAKLLPPLATQLSVDQAPKPFLDIVCNCKCSLALTAWHCAIAKTTLTRKARTEVLPGGSS